MHKTISVIKSNPVNLPQYIANKGEYERVFAYCWG